MEFPIHLNEEMYFKDFYSDIIAGFVKYSFINISSENNLEKALLLFILQLTLFQSNLCRILSKLWTQIFFVKMRKEINVNWGEKLNY